MSSKELFLSSRSRIQVELAVVDHGLGGTSEFSWCIEFLVCKKHSRCGGPWLVRYGCWLPSQDSVAYHVQAYVQSVESLARSGDSERGSCNLGPNLLAPDRQSFPTLESIPPGEDYNLNPREITSRSKTTTNIGVKPTASAVSPAGMGMSA